MIYLHIPFCKQACSYCNFHFSTSLAQKENLVSALKKELELQKKFLKGPVETIYFGGGTPSLLTIPELEEIFKVIQENYDLADLKEVTLEANPDDITTGYLHDLSKTLVNRLSFGVQSFIERDLRFMSRAHNAGQSVTAIEDALSTGFTNLSIDFIYGTPGLTDEEWVANLQKNIYYNIPHFSAYALTLEEGTLLYHNILNKKQAPLNAEQSVRQFKILMDWAAGNGYEHYEISNFAKAGHYSKHNTSYWQGKPYLGVGPSAHSYDGDKIRQWNIANNALYIKSLDEGAIPFEQEILTRVQQANEFIFTSLRTKWGIDLNKFARKFGDVAKMRLVKNVGNLKNINNIVFNEECVQLTEEGKIFADGIAADLFFEKFENL